MTTQPTPPAASELKLTQGIKDLVNTAFARGRMLSVAYVNPEGKPQISFRGSLQAYSDTQLAIWVRNPQGGILQAVRAGNTHIAILYGEVSAQSKAFLTFYGRDRIDDAETVRSTVYENSSPHEQGMDKERKGVSLLIDLDSVSGFFGGERLQMRR